MEALMNGMLARGAQKKRLQGKAFGGGNVISSLTGVSIGQRNAEFAREWLARAASGWRARASNCLPRT